MSDRRAEEQKTWGFAPPERLGVVLEPRAASRFRCPLHGELAWESGDVFNPAAAVRDGCLHLLYRAEDHPDPTRSTSRIGLAVSEDGTRFERDPKPVLFPADDAMRGLEAAGGCEDPRLVEDEEGGYVLTYTALHRDNPPPRLCVATSDDMRHWRKHGPAFAAAGLADQRSKAGAILCRLEGERLVATRVGGVYWMYWLRPGCLFAATSRDLIHWHPCSMRGKAEEKIYDAAYAHQPFGADDPDTETPMKAVAHPRRGRFDNALVEPGPPALWTAEGIVLIYNAWNRAPDGDPSIPDRHYTVGELLLDPEDPTAVIGRRAAPWMQPAESYEIEDAQLVPCAFVSALAPFRGGWLGYYGTADRYVAAFRTAPRSPLAPGRSESAGRSFS